MPIDPRDPDERLRQDGGEDIGSVMHAAHDELPSGMMVRDRDYRVRPHFVLAVAMLATMVLVAQVIGYVALAHYAGQHSTTADAHVWVWTLAALGGAFGGAGVAYTTLPADHYGDVYSRVAIGLVCGLAIAFCAVLVLALFGIAV